VLDTPQGKKINLSQRGKEREDLHRRKKNCSEGRDREVNMSKRLHGRQSNPSVRGREEKRNKILIKDRGPMHDGVGLDREKKKTTEGGVKQLPSKEGSVNARRGRGE